jgi:hypothetical protein
MRRRHLPDREVRATMPPSCNSFQGLQPERRDVVAVRPEFDAPVDQVSERVVVVDHQPVQRRP